MNNVELPELAASSALERQQDFKAYFLQQYLKLNEAIEQFTADMVSSDRGVFRGAGADIRYIVERQMFFALFANRELFEYFVACETGAPLPTHESLSHWVSFVAPYFRGERQRFERPEFRGRILRELYRRQGASTIRTEALNTTRAKVLFHVIHPKFVRYLEPIARRLTVPYAFLTIEHPEMYEELARRGLPRVHVELTPESLAMMAHEVEIRGRKFKPGPFDSWFIRVSAICHALRQLKPNCVVVPEGNADQNELINQSARKVGIRSVCIQQGWAPVIHPGFRNMSYGSMCVWGERFSAMLASFNPKQRFVATGSHVISCRPQGKPHLRKAISFLLQNGTHWMTDQVWQNMLDLIIWTANRFPDYEIRVREHPGTPLSELEFKRISEAPGIKIKSPSDSTLEETLAGSRVSVSINSTTILEAIAAGSVPLMLNVSGFGPYSPDLVSSGAAVEVTGFGQARQALEQLAENDDYLSSFADAISHEQRRLFANDAEVAREKIAKVIERPAIWKRYFKAAAIAGDAQRSSR